jgi:hypothetical protein
MALTLTHIAPGGTGGEEPGVTAVSIAAGACTLNITDAPRQTLFVGFSFDDQSSTARTITITYNGVAPTGLVGGRSATTGQWFEVYYWNDPPSGSAFDLLVSASPAFNNRRWVVNPIVANDINQTTPYDTPVLTENAAGTSIGSTVSSATGDIVLSYGCIDNKTAGGVTAPGAGATGGTTVLREVGTNGNVYLGSMQIPGAASVTSDYTWTGPAIAIDLSFNLNEDTGGGGGQEPTLSWLPVSRVVRGQAWKAVTSGMMPPSDPD